MFSYIEIEFEPHFSKQNYLRMPLSDYPVIQNLIDGDYDFKFGEYISNGFDIFKKHLGAFVGYAIVYLLISSVLSFIPFVGQAISSLLGPVFIVGFYIVANKVENGELPEFGEFFSGFNYAGQIVLRNLATVAIFLICALPFIYFNYSSGLGEWIMLMSSDPEYARYGMEEFPGFSPASLFLLLPIIYLGIAYSWADMFIVFKGMNFWDAMEASRKVITKKWLIIFAFGIVVGIIALSGFIGLCIGLLFTLPAAMCMSYSAFADVAKINEKPLNDKDDLLDHLVSN